MKERQKNPRKEAGVSSRLAELLARCSRGTEPPLPAQTWHSGAGPLCPSHLLDYSEKRRLRWVTGLATPPDRRQKGEKQGRNGGIGAWGEGRTTAGRERCRPGPAQESARAWGSLGAPKARILLRPCQQGHPRGVPLLWGHSQLC